MADKILPDSLTSGGAALAARAKLEETYAAEVDPTVVAYVESAYRKLIDSIDDGANPLSLSWFMAEWEAAMTATSESLPATSTFLSVALDHPLATTLFLAGTAAILAGQREGLSHSGVAQVVSVALGRERDPAAALPGMLERFGLSGAAPGRVVGPDGTMDTTATSQGMARAAATADFGSSMLAQLRAEGYTHKRWMTRYDSRVRESHSFADRQTIPLEDSFQVGGALLRFPGDPMGPIHEIAGCRCVLVGVNFGRHKLDKPEGTAPWNNPRPPGI